MQATKQVTAPKWVVKTNATIQTLKGKKDKSSFDWVRLTNANDKLENKSLSNVFKKVKELNETQKAGILGKSKFPSFKDFKDVDLRKVASVQEMPIQSCIVEANKKEKHLNIRGFAWSGGGRGIIRVDVSIDGGKTWNSATLKEGSEQNLNRAWAWTFWELNVDLDRINDKIICKATDSSYNTQPERSDLAWNVRGLNNNSWHKIDYN